MTKALTYVELDLPEFPGGAVEFDGAVWLVSGAGLTGAADSKMFTASFWTKNSSADPGATRFISASNSIGGNDVQYIRLSSTGLFLTVSFANAANTDILVIDSDPMEFDRWHHVVMSFDLSDTSKRHIYIDDVASALSVITYTNDTIDFTRADWAIGAMPSGSGPHLGSMAHVWFNPGTYIDLSVEANRRLFLTETGGPANLGSDGSEATGTAPLIYLSGDVTTWHTNKGTGGGFTVTNGSLGATEVTFRFTTDVSYLPSTIDAIPSIKAVNISPAIISLGKDLGQRASVDVTFKDHRHIFDGEDYYSGSFWGKFRARYGLKLRGYPMRVINGALGDALTNMETRHFVIESVDGPTLKGEYKVIGKDVLKFADGDRAQAPLPSNGRLVANVLAAATSFTLTPTGVGDDYPGGLSPNNFYINVGGSEVMLVTNRVGDVLTVTRAQFNTVAIDHTAGDRVQLCLYYNGEDVADIIYDLLTTYSEVDAAFISLATWQAETGAFLNTVYTALITDPTAVNDLVSELIEQAGLCVWWDDISEQIKLQVLRAIATTAFTYDGDNTLADSLEIKEQPEKRVSQVITYFGKKNPLLKQDQIDNYLSTATTIDTLAEFEYGSPAIKKVFSRWIPSGGRTVAESLNDILISRYRDPPRRISFDLMRYSLDAPVFGLGYQVGGWPFQRVDGEEITVPVQLTRINPRADIFEVEAEEMLFTAAAVQSPDNHVIIIDANQNNVNLRTMHDSIYGVPVSGATVTCTITEGVTVGSSSRATPAMEIGIFPAGVTVVLIVLGRIQGCGGGGGTGGSAILAVANSGSSGQSGGTALYTRQAIQFTDTNGETWGGGGGGGGGGGFTDNENPEGGNGGSGGAGTNGGAAGAGGFGTASTGANGLPGTANAGGAGVPGNGIHGGGGAGGGPGLAGSTGGSGAGGTGGGGGGAAGKYFDGNSFITVVGGVGDRRGGVS